MTNKKVWLFVAAILVANAPGEQTDINSSPMIAPPSSSTIQDHKTSIINLFIIKLGALLSRIKPGSPMDITVPDPERSPLLQGLQNALNPTKEDSANASKKIFQFEHISHQYQYSAIIPDTNERKRALWDQQQFVQHVPIHDLILAFIIAKRTGVEDLPIKANIPFISVFYNINDDIHTELFYFTEIFAELIPLFAK